MYCRNCGAEVNEKAVVCTKCGVLIGDGDVYCQICGYQHDPKAVICVKCGCALKSFGSTHTLDNQVCPTPIPFSHKVIVNNNVFSMQEAIKSCWKKYASFSGRACRAEFWYWSLFNFLIGVLFVILFQIAMGYMITYRYHEDLAVAISIISLITELILFLPSLSVVVRRLHDIGKNGWFCLISLIPIVGALFLLIWFVRDSSLGENKYGTNPKC